VKASSNSFTMRLLSLNPTIFLLLDLAAPTAGGGSSSSSATIAHLEDSLKSNEKIDVLLNSVRAEDPTREDRVKIINLPPPTHNLRTLQRNSETALHDGLNDFSGLFSSARRRGSLLGEVSLVDLDENADDVGKSTGFDIDGVVTDSAQEDSRNLQSCVALTSAIPITLDPEGVLIQGTTAGAPSNLPTTGSCGTNNDSPTVWYSFSTAARATIGVTTW
jgi:hypothetical protein